MKLEYEDLTYKIIGACIEVHNQLGKGFNEIVYKDCLEIELNLQSIPYSREKEFDIEYKNIIIPHKYFADFIIYDKIILEVKAVESIANSHSKQVLNYLAATHLKLGLVVNFGENSLTHKRVIL